MNLSRMLHGLVLADVEFVLVGGAAMVALGSAHVTNDIDICYASDPGSIRRLCALLREWNAVLRGAPAGLPFTLDERQFRSTPVMSLSTVHGDLDVMDRVAGVGDFPSVRAAAIHLALDGFGVHVLDLAGLIAAKKAAGREKDLRQLPELEALLELRGRG
jgi:predicted nucleotidyltransferase